MSFKVFAQQFLAATAVEAFAAELGVVSADLVADSETFDVLANGGNDTDSFVTGNQGELSCVIRRCSMGLCMLDRELTLARNSPSWMCKSVPQTPQARTLICMPRCQ